MFYTTAKTATAAPRTAGGCSRLRRRTSSPSSTSHHHPPTRNTASFATMTGRRTSTTAATTTSGLLTVMLLLLFVATVDLGGVAAQQSTTCDLDCQNNAPCVLGSANFDNQPNNYDGSDFDFHETTSIRGMHCACSHGWTGVLCDVPYESCDGQHICYNNGQCIPGLQDDYGNEQLYCDCSNAYDEDGNQYVGKYCEQKVDQIDNNGDFDVSNVDYCDDEQTLFCINGGECNTKYPRVGDPCLCPVGYEGPNCQYATGSVPTCDMDCQNGGYCTFDLSPTQQEEQEQYLFRFWQPGVDDMSDPDPVHARCECTDEWDGEYCEIPRIQCGPNHYCYNGGTCLQRVVGGGANTVYHCDCTSSYTDERSYAGRYCQYEATSYCTKRGNINDHLFCVNDGTCKSDPYEGCNCVEPYTGFSCEFVEDEVGNTGNTDVNTVGENDNGDIPVDFGYDDVDNYDDPGAGDGSTGNGNVDVERGFDSDGDADQYGGDSYGDFYDGGDGSDSGPADGGWVPATTVYDCDLKCKNGGTCRIGIKQQGDYLEDLSQNAPHLNQTDDNFRHCVCPDGYYGIYCEEQVDVCGDEEHYCLHGSECVRKDGNEHGCDCVTANSEVASVFAGDSCEHPVNDVCNIGYDDNSRVDTTPLSFCVNGGRCKEKIQLGAPHPGCVCQDGFTGPHCELREGVTAAGYGNGFGSEPSRVIAVVVAFVAAAIVAGLLVFGYRRRRYSKNKHINEALKWSSSYRDEPDNGPNLAPRRSSALEGAYPVNRHASNRDPMASHLAPAPAPTHEVIYQAHHPTSTSSSSVDSDDHHHHHHTQQQEEPEQGEAKPPQVYIGPPRDEDGHELHNVEII